MINPVSDIKDRYYRLSDDKQKTVFWIATSASLLILLTIMIVSGLVDRFDQDVINYYNDISDIFDKQLMPYSDYVFEYPPLTLLMFLVPKLLSWDLTSFYVVFCIWTTVFTFISIYFTFKLCEHFKIDRFKVMILLIIMMFVANKMMLQRNDIFAVGFVIISLYLFINRKYVPSSIMLTCAAFIKIYPIILIPIFTIALLVKKDWKNTMTFLIIAIITGLMIQLPFLINDPSSAFAYISYHSDRGMQVESVMSTILLMVDLFIPIVDSIEPLYGSLSLTGDVPDMIAEWMNVVIVVALIATAIWFIARLWSKSSNEEKDFQMLCLMSIIITMVFITFSKVYSAQYMLWIFAFIPFIKWNHVNHKTMWVVLLTFILLISIDPIFSYIAKGPMTPLPEIALFAKNVAHVILMILFIKIFHESTKKEKYIQTAECT